MDREKISDVLKPIIKAVSTILLSTLECKCNFIAMNNIMTAKQSELYIPPAANLLFLNAGGSPITQFDLNTNVKSQLILNEKQVMTVWIHEFLWRNLCLF
jgi:hypothetical protein